MEGVLVSAQEAGSPITVTVVSDALGRFRFPDGRSIAPGTTAAHSRDRLRSRRPENRGTRRLGPAYVAIKLTKTADLAAKRTNTEWLMSMPGTAEQKQPLWSA